MSKITYGWLAKGRKTVVDLLTMIGPNSVPTHIFQDMDMTWANELRSQLKSRGVKITFTVILLKAIAVAQQNYPATRSDLLPFGRMVTYEDIVAGFTIERNQDGDDTVFFGEIEQPAEKALVDIANDLTRYAQADTADLAPLELQNKYSRLPYFIRKAILSIGSVFPTIRVKCQKATFGLTTLGKYGVKAVLSPCICTSTFGVGVIEDRAVVVNGELAVRPMMTVTLNYNAKVVDQSQASKFLMEVTELMQGGLKNFLGDECVDFVSPKIVELLLSELETAA